MSDWKLARTGSRLPLLAFILKGRGKQWRDMPQEKAHIPESGEDRGGGPPSPQRQSKHPSQESKTALSAKTLNPAVGPYRWHPGSFTSPSLPSLPLHPSSQGGLLRPTGRPESPLWSLHQGPCQQLQGPSGLRSAQVSEDTPPRGWDPGEPGSPESWEGQQHDPCCPGLPLHLQGGILGRLPCGDFSPFPPPPSPPRVLW